MVFWGTAINSGESFPNEIDPIAPVSFTKMPRPEQSERQRREEKELCRLTAEEVQDVVAALRVAVDPVLDQYLQTICVCVTVHPASKVHVCEAVPDIR